MPVYYSDKLKPSGDYKLIDYVDVDGALPIYIMEGNEKLEVDGNVGLTIKSEGGIKTTFDDTTGLLTFSSTSGATGSTNDTNELFIIGSKTQSESAQTYSNSGFKIRGDYNSGLILSMGPIPNDAPFIRSKNHNLLMTTNSPDSTYSTSIELDSHITLDGTTDITGPLSIESGSVHIYDTETDSSHDKYQKSSKITKGNLDDYLEFSDEVGYSFGDRQGNSPIVISNGRVNAPIGFFQTSDKRVKTNIKSINTIDADKVKLIEFDRTDTNHHGYGVIAQDVEKYYPSIINTNSEGFKSVDYIELLLIKVKYLENEIERLKWRIGKVK